MRNFVTDHAQHFPPALSLLLGYHIHSGNVYSKFVLVVILYSKYYSRQIKIESVVDFVIVKAGIAGHIML